MKDFKLASEVGDHFSNKAKRTLTQISEVYILIKGYKECWY